MQDSKKQCPDSVFGGCDEYKLDRLETYIRTVLYLFQNFQTLKMRD